jgi:hypothetical protein
MRLTPRKVYLEDLNEVFYYCQECDGEAAKLRVLKLLKGLEE